MQNYTIVFCLECDEDIAVIHATSPENAVKALYEEILADDIINNPDMPYSDIAEVAEVVGIRAVLSAQDSEIKIHFHNGEIN